MIHYILNLVSTTLISYFTSLVPGSPGHSTHAAVMTSMRLLHMRSTNQPTFSRSHRMLAFRRWTVVSVAALRYFSTMPNPTVYFDITAGGKGLGRVTMEVSGWKIIAVS